MTLLDNAGTDTMIAFVTANESIRRRKRMRTSTMRMLYVVSTYSNITQIGIGKSNTACDCRLVFAMNSLLFVIG